MKVLNLYAGIGGNRKLWEDVEVTAIELNPQIAKIYQDFFPNDKVIVADAHQYLLDYFKEFEFIWSSPPCPTHSQLGRMRALNNDKRTGSYLSYPKFPDMRLYEEIIFLKYYFTGKYCIENVVAYYQPLIKPLEIQRHWFWANFYIGYFDCKTENIDKGKIKEYQKNIGFNLFGYSIENKKTVLRNCVNSYLGLHILNESKRNIQPELFNSPHLK